MSKRLLKLDNEWKNLQEQLRECFSSDDAALETSLEALKKETDSQKEKIKKEYAAEFDWEEFVQGTSHHADGWLNLDAHTLSISGLGFLIKKARAFVAKCRKKQTNIRDLLHGVRLHIWRHGQDIGIELLPLIVKLLNEIGPTQLDVSLLEGGDLKCVSYVFQIDDDEFDHNDLPDAAAAVFQHLGFSDDQTFPNMARLMAAYRMTGLTAHANDDRSSTVAFMLDAVRHLGRHLQHVQLNLFHISRGEFQDLVAALSPAENLESFDMAQTKFTEQQSIDTLQRLIQEHDQLYTIKLYDEDYGEISTNEDWPPLSDSFIASVANHPELRELIMPMNEQDSLASLALIQHASESERLRHLSLGDLLHLDKTGSSMKLDIGDCDLLTVVDRFPDTENLVLWELHPSVVWLFRSQACAVSALTIRDGVYDAAMVALASCLRTYTLMKELKLCLEISAKCIRSLCQNSCLQEVDLQVLELSSNVFIPQSTLLLKESKQLKRVKLSVSWHGGKAAGDFDGFEEALRSHQTLQKLELDSGTELAIFLEAVFGALEHNHVLQTLGFCGGHFHADPLFKVIGKAKHLQRLELPETIVTKDRSLSEVLQRNISLCEVHVGFFSQHTVETKRFVARNLLFRQIGEFADVQQQDMIPKCLWPSLIAKAGSVETEPTPLFALLTRGSASLSKPSKKRRSVH